MKLRELGEFGVIDLIGRMGRASRGAIGEIGDDCAIVPFNRQKFLLLTCDMLVEGVDFTPRDSLYLVGRKSLGCCLSDIAACGGIPRYAQVSLALSSKMSVSRLRQLYQGMIAQAKKFGVRIVGGDISRFNKLVIDVRGKTGGYYLCFREAGWLNL